MERQRTFNQEQVRFFLEDLKNDMQARYNAQLPAALVLFDAIMEPGARCEAAKEVFRQWFNNLFRFSVTDTVLERGREFVGVDIIKPAANMGEEEDDRLKTDSAGFYA